MINIPLWLTAEHPCSYLQNKQAQSAVVDPDFPLSAQMYAGLIDQGFRRSGDQVYKPYCDNCQECVPSRIPVQEFQADRRQKRCLQRNTDTKVILKAAEFDPQHLDLYRRYQHSRHQPAGDTPISQDEYMQFLGSSWCNTRFVEFHIAEQLVAVAVVDMLHTGLSAVYTFFDPEFAEFSPGVFAVLWQIEYAKLHNLDYVYLGFWIKDSPKMGYKIQYQPLQGLIDQHWQPISNQL
jgi:arginine-tRNA-protein transferase